VVGVFMTISIIKAQETKKGWCADKTGFDTNWVVLFFFMFLLSPFVLPIGIFAWIIYKISRYIYNRFIKEKELQ
jgi:hypothetical protein